MTTRAAENNGAGGKGRKPPRGRAGAAMLEYLLVCALLVLVGAAASPAAIGIIGASFKMILAVIGSPHPALF